MMQTTKRGRPFLQDTFDLYATLMVSLQLSPHKYFFKTFQNSFSTDEAIQNLSSLKFSKSSRNPDPREPSRLVTTTTTTTFSMTRPMAKAMSQHFMDARLIEDATDPSSHLFKNRGLYVLTPKGLYVLERFISKNGINSDHLQNVFVSQPICTELFHLERRLSDDEIIVTQSVITALFRRFVGRQPNYPNAPQDAFARHAERSRGVLLMDITDRAQPARSPQLHKHRFAAVAALEWLCDFTSVVGKEEAAEMAAQFVRFGLIALVGEEKTDATSVLVARSPAPDGNSPVSTHGEFRCTANSIYQVTDEGGRVAHWDDPTGVHDLTNTSLGSTVAYSSVDEPDHENKKPTDRKIHRHIFIAEKLDHDAQKGTKESNTDRLMYILDEPALRSLFREFLKENFCEENLSFWLEVKDFKRKFDIASSVVAAIPAPSEPNRGATPGQGAMKKHYESLIQTAFLIYNKYLAPSSQCELNIDHGLRNELSKYLEEVVTSMTGKVFQGQVDQEQANAFDATELQTMIRLYERIQTHVFRLMATDSVPKFVKTPKFLAVRNWVEDLNSNQDVDPNEGARAGAHTGPPGLAQAATSPRQPVSLASLKVAGNQTQPEVLHNFFQSLLSSKDRTGTGAGAVVKTSPEANGTGSEAEDAG
ncbi:regulator of G protein signaling domain-containing protein [Mycena polygramma]|nr:regulator of G protein signaling domain-containing protein [Mycena polygramma]